MKYKLTRERITVGKRTLYRIRATKKFANVYKDQVGGFIEKEENLSQKGNCWVHASAMVYDNARVHGNARVLNEAKVYGRSRVYGDARISNNARVSGGAEVYGNAIINEQAWIRGFVKAYGTALITGRARLNETEMIASGIINENSLLFSENDVTFDDDIGSKIKKPRKQKEVEIIRPIITNPIFSLDTSTE